MSADFQGAINRLLRKLAMIITILFGNFHQREV